MGVLVSVIDKLRELLRNYFTIEYSLKNSLSARTKDTTRTIKRSRRCYTISPSERFIWAMVVLIIALIGLVSIEIALILVTGALDEAILFVVCGIIGALVSRFLEAKV